MVNIRSLFSLSVPFVGGGVVLPTGGPVSPPISVECVTTKGNFVVQVHHDWAPVGAPHFLKLVKDDFFTDMALFRCVPKFLAQFGISADPSKKHWHGDLIPDDPHQGEEVHGLKKYQVSFAGSGKNSRSSHLFIAYEDLPGLGKSDWEVPFGVVTKGYETIDAWYTGYGDMPPWGKGPEQGNLHNRGNQYIHEEFPLIDFINRCYILASDDLGGAESTVNTERPSVETVGGKNKGKGGNDRLLRADASEADSGSAEDFQTKKALVAVAVLVVAMVILMCLYKFSSITEGKSR